MEHMDKLIDENVIKLFAAAVKLDTAQTPEEVTALQTEILRCGTWLIARVIKDIHEIAENSYKPS